MFNGLDIDATWSLFHSIMLQLIDKYVPTSSIKLAGPRPMWMNSAALKFVKQKRKAWMKYKATRLRTDFIAYIPSTEICLLMSLKEIYLHM